MAHTIHAQVTKVCPGIYDVAFAGREFEIERVEDGTWQLAERVENRSARLDYWNHFATKRAAIQAIVSELAQ